MPPAQLNSPRELTPNEKARWNAMATQLAARMDHDYLRGFVNEDGEPGSPTVALWNEYLGGAINS